MDAWIAEEAVEAHRGASRAGARALHSLVNNRARTARTPPAASVCIPGASESPRAVEAAGPTEPAKPAVSWLCPSVS